MYERNCITSWGCSKKSGGEGGTVYVYFYFIFLKSNTFEWLVISTLVYTFFLTFYLFFAFPLFYSFNLSYVSSVFLFIIFIIVRNTIIPLLIIIYTYNNDNNNNNNVCLGGDVRNMFLRVDFNVQFLTLYDYYSTRTKT